ncbi:glycosyltransferase family 1 protein [Lanmaoa asiatica]|nr:glycosyltransferase family 1 protein [Lanmaoa asiatica]
MRKMSVPPVMSSLPTVLIFTYPEYGQANVNLATAYELALAGVNVHIASFAPLGTRIPRLQELVVRHASRSSSKPTGSIVFHECKGVASWADALHKHGVDKTTMPHSHGVAGALESYSKLDFLLFPWSQDEHLASIESCKEIIATTKPNVVVIDILFNSAQDACKLVDQKFMVIVPNSIWEVAAIVQPYLAALWKYPAPSSGFPFPLEWWQIPLNIYLTIRLVRQIKTSVHLKQIFALRRSLGFNSLFGDQANRRYSGVTYICAALAETDFHFAVIPKEVLLCGPIVMPFDPLEESDPALMKWLDNGPTVMINLGSHILSDERFAAEMASAFRILLNYHDRKGASKIQVLWKAKASGDIQTTIDKIIGKEVKEGRVKVLPWLEAEPISILQHPNLVCTVHHGGANSYYEGIWSGVPHIVLPVWYDTFHYASRAEFLDIGIFGNKTCAPSVRADEFGRALLRITGNTEEAINFKMSAERLKERCRVNGNGRELACGAILKEAGVRK